MSALNLQGMPRAISPVTGSHCTEVTYYFRGSETYNPTTPFGRCTRKGDYMIVHRTEEHRCRAGFLAIGVRVNEDVKPTITTESFPVKLDGRLLKPRIRQLRGKDGWWAQIVWELPLGWRQLRIDTNITRISMGKITSTTARFQLGFFNEKVAWEIFDVDEKTRKPSQAPGDATAPCFP